MLPRPLLRAVLLRGNKMKTPVLHRTQLAASTRYCHTQTPPPTSSSTQQQQQEQQVRSSSSSSSSAAQRRSCENPMETLSRVFHQHPSALRLHRELTIRLAEGDAEGAADVAAVLATTVGRVRDALEATPPSTEEGHGEGSSLQKAGREGADAAAAGAEIPMRASLDDIDETTELTQRTLLGNASTEEYLDVMMKTESGSSQAPSRDSTSSEQPFWRSPESLCVTILESAFESAVPDGEAAGTLSEVGSSALDAEQQQLEILDEYLRREDARWKAQKNAIAKVVLDVARQLGMTPEDLHAAEGGQGTGALLNALKHSNVVVRGECPQGGAAESDVVEERIREQLGVLKKRMAAQGSPLSAAEEQMARYELVMSHTSMRYVIGIHRDLQVAMDQSPAVREAMAASNGGDEEDANAKMKGSAYFVQRVMEELHKTPDEITETTSQEGHESAATLSVQRVEIAEQLMAPVLPFTYMLKCCLWFDIPATPSSE